jgi:hypothetical protein
MAKIKCRCGSSFDSVKDWRKHYYQSSIAWMGATQAEIDELRRKNAFEHYIMEVDSEKCRLTSAGMIYQ